MLQVSAARGGTAAAFARQNCGGGNGDGVRGGKVDVSIHVWTSFLNMV